MRTPSSWSEPRLHKLLFEQSADATVVIDDDGRVLMANRASRELHGVDVDQLFRWAPRRDADLASFRAQLRVGGKASCELKVRVAGEVRRLALEGRAHGPFYAVVLRDVTDARSQDEELRHLRKLEAMGLLTASLVHDFNNVLTTMVISAGLLSKGGEATMAAELSREILGAGERASSLVRRVLRVLRREPARPDRVSLATVVREMEELLRLVAGPSTDMTLELDPETGDVVVDREQLDHVLINLVANAREAMPRGGKLVLSTANVRPSTDAAPGEAVEAGAGGDYVALTLTDTGGGMTPEVRERIFERFFTTKDASGGLGLGLATAHRFVTESGGCITVRSTPGAGTSVMVYFPRATSRAKVIELPRTDSPAPTGKETVLVIESDDHVRFVVRAALMDRGYRVIDAPTGEAALRMVRHAEKSVQLVLADLGSPGIDGRNVTMRLREEGHAPALLWMTGMTDGGIAEHGATEEPMLRKAFTPNELARRVREALDAASAPAQMAEGS